MNSFNSAYGAAHLPSPTTRLHGVRGKKDHALFFGRPFLMQFAIDVLAVLVAFTLIAASCIGFGFALFALLFLSF